MRLKIRCDCAAEPPGELMTSATAFAPGTEKARSSMGATLAMASPVTQRHHGADGAGQAHHRHDRVRMVGAELAWKEELQACGEHGGNGC